MVHFIGAGPGDPELLTIKGKKLIDNADVIIYAGSLVNKEVLAGAKEGAKIYNSATMTLEDVIEVMKEADAKGLDVRGCTPATRPSSGRTGSRWMSWTDWALPTRSFRASAHFLPQRRPCRKSRRCRAFPRRSS